MPARPFVLLAQPSAFDPSRTSSPEQHVVWAYAHVPNNYPGDARPLIEAQIERFAPPGFKELVIAASSRTASELETYNPNYIGGDILGGTVSAAQMVRRPVVSRAPMEDTSRGGSTYVPHPRRPGLACMEWADSMQRALHSGINSTSASFQTSVKGALRSVSRAATGLLDQLRPPPRWEFNNGLRSKPEVQWRSCFDASDHRERRSAIQSTSAEASRTALHRTRLASRQRPPCDGNDDEQQETREDQGNHCQRVREVRGPSNTHSLWHKHRRVFPVEVEDPSNPV